MKKFVYADHNSLQTALNSLKNELKDRELQLKADSKTVISKLPGRIFSKKSTDHRAVQNPGGKLLAKFVNQVFLKKENFLIKFVAGLFSKQVGKSIAQNLLKSK